MGGILFLKNIEFLVVKSEFLVVKSDFRVVKSEFRVRKSEFRVRKSEFCVAKSEFNKRPYTIRFIANSKSCTTTSLSKVFTSYLTAIKNHWIKYCEKTYEREGTLYYFWSIKNSIEILK